jgi:hypothetical protein
LRIIQLVNPSNNPGNEVTFLVMNKGTRKLHAGDVLIQAKSGEGWVTISHERRVSLAAIPPGETRQVRVANPTGQACRMRIIYQYWLRGPDLWLSQLGIALRSRRSGELMMPNIVGVEPLISEKVDEVDSWQDK